MSHFLTMRSVSHASVSLRYTRIPLDLLRPVISSTGSLTDTLSKFVDHFLKDIVTQLPSYLKDTKDLLNCLNNDSVNPNRLLVTMDVNNLYICIPHDTGLASTFKALQTLTLRSLPILFWLNY